LKGLLWSFKEPSSQREREREREREGRRGEALGSLWEKKKSRAI
jgi:hypothetical protein